MMSPGKDFFRARQWKWKGARIVFPEPPALAMQVELQNHEYCNTKISDV